MSVRPPRDPAQKPIALLLFERSEASHIDPRDGSVSKAELKLSYTQLQARGIFNTVRCGGEFKATFDRNVWLGSGGAVVSLTGAAVFLDLPDLEGHRIGTYLMNEVVGWARQWPEANVATIELVERQGADPEKRARRNRFYEQFGVKFVYSDPAQKAGKSLPMQVESLNEVETWKQNIEEIGLLDFLVDGLNEKERLESALEPAKRSAKEWWEAYEYTLRHPIRHAAKIIWAAWLPGFALVSFLLLTAFAAFRHLW